MIVVHNLRKIYGKKDTLFTALDNVSFEIPDGRSVAIVGKSGSGKSTLVHIMGGLDHPTDGNVVVDGKDISTLNRKQLDTFRSHDLGFVFQSFFVEANQTCYQNVALPLEIARTGLRERKKLIAQALERVGLLDKINAKAGNLSGGQKQRLAIARAIVHEPRIILADEPTGNLDSETGEKIIRLLFDLNKQQKSTLVVVTHDAELAARCDMRIAIKDGQITQITGVDKPSGSSGKKGAKR